MNTGLPYSQRPLIEPLEQRLLLAAAPAIAGCFLASANLAAPPQFHLILSVNHSVQPGSTAAQQAIGVIAAAASNSQIVLSGASLSPGQPVLAAASDTGQSNADSITNLNNGGAGGVLQIIVPGTTAGATVTLYYGGVAIGSAVAGGMTTTVTTDGLPAHVLPDGACDITARQTEPGDSESPDSTPLTIWVDTHAPTASVPDLNSASDTGVGSSDNITQGVNPQFDGTANDPASNGYASGIWKVVVASDDGKSATDSASPFYSLVLPTIAEGSRTITATVYDVAGNSRTTGGLTVTTDRTGPRPILGTLDAAFGRSGKIVTGFGQISNGGYAVGIQSSGKIVVGAYTYSGSSDDFAVGRFHPDGSLDTTFGTGGWTVTPAGGNDNVFDLVVQSDNKIILVGSSFNGNQDFAVVRYDADGGLDASFGAGGKATIDFGGMEDWATSAALQADGKIVVTGVAGIGSSQDTALVRYNPDGTLDSTFGTGGKVVTSVAPSYDQGLAVAILPDGKILVGGTATAVSDNYDFALLRYNPNGTLDSGFGTGGIVTTPIGVSADIANAMVVQPDGKIVLGGQSIVGSYYDFALARYLPSGSLDPSFGTGGKVTTSFGTAADYANAVVLMNNGDIAAIGTYDSPTARRLAVAYFTPGGALDTSAYASGKFTLPMSEYEYGDDAILCPNGNLVITGRSAAGAYLVKLATGIAQIAPLDMRATSDSGQYNWDNVTNITSISFDVAVPDSYYRVYRDETLISDPWQTAASFTPSLAQPEGAHRYAVAAVDVAGNETFSLPVEIIIDATSPTMSAPNLDASSDTGISGSDAVTSDATPLFKNDPADPASGAAASGIWKVTIESDDGTAATVTGAPYDVVMPTLSQRVHVITATVYDVAGNRTVTGGLPLLVDRTPPQVSGDWDPAFGQNGIVQTTICMYTNQGNAMAIQPDGRIVVAGRAYVSVNYDFAVVRYLTDGSLDPTFGTGGIVTTPIASNDEGQTLVIQNDGKIVVAGTVAGNGYRGFGLVRYNPDGSLDATFGGAGTVVTKFGTILVNAYGLSLALQPDGKLIVAGYVSNASAVDFAVARYNVDGSLDASFGSGGKVTTPVGSGSDYGRSVAVQSDGKIVVVGHVNSGAASAVCLVRYNTDGTLDGTFGTNGKVIAASTYSNYDNPQLVTLQPDGKILVVGYSAPSSNGDLRLFRYNSNGTLDLSFGNAGVAQTSLSPGDDRAYSAVLLPDGRILVGGYAAGSPAGFAIVRYDHDGSLDAEFGIGGAALAPFGTVNSNISIGVQADGNIVLAGSEYKGNGQEDFAVTRYRVNPDPPVALAHASDTGGSDSDGITGCPTPVFNVNVGPFFRFYCDGAPVGDAYLIGDIFTSPTQTDGVHRYAISTVDIAGNESEPSQALTVTVDTVPPTATVNSLVTTSPSTAMTGTVDDPQASVLISLAGTAYAATNNGDGTWTLTAGVISPGLKAGTYDVAVTATDVAGNVGQDATSNELRINSTIAGRSIFYNRSAWDWDIAGDSNHNGQYDPGEDGTNDDAAMASDKVALLPGGKATFANYTSYSRGINGIMIDIAGLPGTLSATDFIFKVGNTNDPTTWATVAAPVNVSVRSQAGVDGSDRVVLTWADNAITKKWLQVTVKSDANGGHAGLARDDVFYFGNAIGECGNNVSDALVNATDQLGPRDNPHGLTNLAPIDDRFDYNRDRLVDALDMAIAQANQTSPLTALRLIAAPAFKVQSSGQVQLSSEASPSVLTLVSGSVSPPSPSAGGIAAMLPTAETTQPPTAIADLTATDLLNTDLRPALVDLLGSARAVTP